ncbi:hypothetical protein LB823_14290 [Tsukamurella sp. M9C]|nr:hypothetical protein [Tsukamurella sp. M9C]
MEDDEAAGRGGRADEQATTDNARTAPTFARRYCADSIHRQLAFGTGTSG